MFYWTIFACFGMFERQQLNVRKLTLILPFPLLRRSLWRDGDVVHPEGRRLEKKQAIRQWPPRN